jgi:ERCC4-related helicase
MQFIDPPAPGARVRVRGEEWAVEKSLPLPTGGHAVYVQGVSELVRYHQAIFLTPLDKDIVPLRAEDTRLVNDESPGYRQSSLFLETLLRRTPPTHDRIAMGHRGALDVMPYQLVPAHESLKRLQPRILIADGTGLGKTVEIGIMLSELIKRGRGRRILVVAIRSMLAQLQRELWARFTLPLVRLDAEGIARVQGKIPSHRNPFSYFDRVIVSMDTIKTGRYRAWLEQIRWDVIVVDECHNVANRGSDRAGLAQLLSAQCDALILTSATPHNGKPESFANLMRMLDPTSIANPHSFTKEDIAHLFVRRFKKDVEKDAGGQLRDREVATHAVMASAEEEAALEALHSLTLSTLGRKQGRRDALLKWTLIKAFLSSPEAALESLDHRIQVTRRALNEGEGTHPRAGEIEKDLERIHQLRDLVVAAQDRGFGKLARLLEELRKIGFDGGKRSPRVVIFSERIATLDYLKRVLAESFNLKSDDAIGVFTAREADETKQRALVESFGHAESPLRVLLCSDAASEGVNLHHQCHHLFHFDVPWSLIRLTQRNGRIDRFGQQHTPHLRYLITKTKGQTADQHVVERLIEKEREVERQLGDPGALLGLYDAEREEDFVLKGLASGKDADELLPDAPRLANDADAALRAVDEESGEASPTEAPPDVIEEPEIDLLALLAGIEAEQARTPLVESLIAETPSLFASDYELLVAALHHLESHPVVGPEPLKWTSNAEERFVTIEAPEPFRRHREGFLPREGIPAKGQPYRLAQGRELVMTKLRAALDDEGRWPEWHLLWEQHPLVEWILDALGSAYARGEAPIMRVPSLGAGNAIFLLQGSMFNHESEAVVAQWMGIVTHEARIETQSSSEAQSLSLDEVIARARLRIAPRRFRRWCPASCRRRPSVCRPSVSAL